MLAHFDRRQLLFLRTEDLAARPTALTDQVTAFLGLSPAPKDVALTPPSDHPPMDATDRRFLHAIYEPELDRLEALLDWDCTAWRGET
jgi:hypothetical protein